MTQSASARILITVMTYPHPSKGYQELVCTAGITESVEWVRLYPVDYRYRPREQQFHKYQWIEVAFESHRTENDKRKESRRPKLDSIRVFGEPLSTANQWAARKDYIDRMPHHTVNRLKSLYDQERISLGVVRPTRVLDLEIREATSDWKPEW
jgi:hypothetical protein